MISYTDFSGFDHQSGKLAGIGRIKHPELWRGCVGAFAPILGATGNCWIDFSTFRHCGTRTNGLLWTNDLGYCGEFDGDNDYVELGTIKTNDPLQLATGELSIAFWINPIFTGDAFQRVFDKSSGGNAASGYALYRVNTSQINFNVNGNGHTTVSALTTGIWTHVVVTKRDGENPRFYFNGAEVSVGAGPNQNVPSVQTNMRIGTWNHSTGREYKGKLDDMRFYNRILTSREILMLAQYRGVAYAINRTAPFFEVAASTTYGRIIGESSLLSNRGILV